MCERTAELAHFAPVRAPRNPTCDFSLSMAGTPPVVLCRRHLLEIPRAHVFKPGPRPRFARPGPGLHSLPCHDAITNSGFLLQPHSDAAASTLPPQTVAEPQKRRLNLAPDPPPPYYYLTVPSETLDRDLKVSSEPPILGLARRSSGFARDLRVISPI